MKAQDNDEAAPYNFRSSDLAFVGWVPPAILVMMSLAMVSPSQGDCPMTHDVILAAAFLAMLIAPCIVAMRHEGGESGE